MESRAVSGRPRTFAVLRQGAVVLAMLCEAMQASAATPAPTGSSGRPTFYSCYAGTRVTKSDQEFADCAGVQTRTTGAIEERILTTEQAAIQEKCERDKAETLAKWRTSDRYNKNLLVKYPESVSLRSAREADLASARDSVARSETRLVDLDKERKKLALDREFYPKEAPPKLQRSIDDNDALVAAQQQVLKKAQDDVARIGANFDALEKYMIDLWKGRAPPQPSIDCGVERLFGPIPRR